MKKIKVYLYIEGFDCSPEDISQDLGILPDKVAVKGQITPGHKIPSRFNIVELHSSTIESEDLDKQIQSIFSKLGDMDRLKKQINDYNLNIGINTIVHLNGDASPACAMFISNDTLAKMTSLGCEVDFDIYA